MKLLKKYIPLAFLALFISSCKNDLDLNAPYKEYPSIYAVLNPDDSVQMIRINKVFLGETDANVMAKVADSINYKPGEITVSIVHSDSPSNPIVFTESVVTTSSGAFNTTQRVYVDTTKLLTWGTYTLIVKNNHTGNVFTSSASPIDSVNGNQGYEPLALPYVPFYDPLKNEGFIDYKNNAGSILFKPVDKSKIYQVIIRSHFEEYGTSATYYNYVDYIFNDPKEIRNIPSNSTNKYISIRFRSIDYFASVGYALSKMNLAERFRKMYMMEYIIHASTQELLDYIEYSKPSLSISQNKPLYSNFVDRKALGIFAFRSTCRILKKLDPGFIDGFSYDPNTCGYRFYNSKNVWLGCN
jgi:PBP1b-binding outer membrane lipoprotein LpoB